MIRKLYAQHRLRYRQHEWRIAMVLFVAYVIIDQATVYFLRPASTGLHPAIVIALCALFFGGLRLWPVAYVAALAGSLIAGETGVVLIIVPISVTIQAVVGAYFLRGAGLDPLFRRYRDMAILAGVIIVISALFPSSALLVNLARGTDFSAETWGQYYVAMVFCFVVLLSLLLRWLTKPRFSRPISETLETLVVFAILIGINIALFLYNVGFIFGVQLLYFMLVPLFWIALRLRPRFVTLSILITSIFAITSIFLKDSVNLSLVQDLYSTEILIIVLSSIFLTITSVEEDRRVNTTLMHSQLHTLENAVTRISNESRAKNDFIAMLAHELRNPLAPVVSGIDLLKLKGSRDTEDGEMLDMMADRMDIVRRLLDDLLDISRISEGKVMLKHETVNMEVVINRAILSTNHYRSEMHQNLVFKTSNKPLEVSGDAVRIEQIFWNLLTNASKYSDSGDTITLVMKELNGFAEIDVIDEGVGLDKSALDKIFLPFHQIDQGERTSKGLGIGLALVQSFVEMLDGTVSVESKGPGKGSRFVVRLPLKSHANKRIAAVHDRAEDLLAGAKQSSSLVLVVDDNDAAAGAMGRLLKLQGYRLIYAYDGESAIEQAMNFAPQVVLLDVGLPDQDGYTVAKALRTRGFPGRLIALTGYSTIEDKRRAQEAGFDDFLAKPAGLSDLRRVLPELK